MKKIKAFFYVFKNSFDPKYYKDVLKAPFGFSLKYYFFYFLIFGFCTSFYLGFRYFVPLSKSLENLPEKIVEYFPDDLVLEVKDGIISSNYNEPVIISADLFESVIKDLEDEFGNFEYDELENLLVVDTNAQIDDFENYRTMVLVTANNIVNYSENGTYQVSPLEEANDFVLNKTTVEENIEGFNFVIRYLPIFFGLMIFWVMVGVVPAALMIYLIFYSVVMMFISSLNNKKLDFKKSFQIGMHLETLWMTVVGLITLIEWRFRVPFMQTLFMVIYSVMILKEIIIKEKI